MDKTQKIGLFFSNNKNDENCTNKVQTDDEDEFGLTFIIRMLAGYPTLEISSLTDSNS